MEKRVVVFLLVSLAIIFGYEYVLKEFGLLPETTVVQDSNGTASDKQDASLPAVPSDSQSNGTRSQAVSASSELGSSGVVAAEPATVSEQVLAVETGLYRAKFSTKGAVLTSWELTRYQVSTTDHTPVQLVRQGSKFAGPLAVSSADTTVAKKLSEGLYAVERDFTTLDASYPEGHVTFRYRDEDGTIAVEKRLTFHADSYLVDIQVTTSGIDGAAQVGLGTNFGIVEWSEGMIGQIGAASLVDGKVEKDMPEAELERSGNVQWLALQDKYFLSVLIPKSATSVLVKKEGDKLLSAKLHAPVTAAGSTLSLQLYAGPKEYDTLQALHLGLEDTIDFGWFVFGSWGVVKAIAKPIFYVLRFLNEYTHNFGVTIILLTMGLKALFVPLQFKSYKSMKQMQVIQPKVLALQEKYKDDRDRLNKELIKLYRDHKVNPVGGCLPMILQMPVFVALFNILYMTIDLRQSPFMGWITDLSIQDPYYVLPIIMGVTMVIQQKITPTTMDPTQAKMMLVLPAFMTFLFINFPAGLVLYWLTNNVLTITQQLVTDRVIFAKNPVVEEPGTGSSKR